MSASAFRTAWDHLDLGAMPIVLHVPDDPAPWHELTERGLARGGELDPWLGAACKLVANPPRSVDLRLGFGSSAVRALAASAGAEVVLVVLSGNGLTVRESATDLAGALVELLPRHGEDLVGGPDLSGRFGAAVIDAAGRRRRAADVVDFHGPVDPAVLRSGIAALLAELRP
ncbi:ESX secretion-associated protein EspG [Actinosynnema sp. NPDC047251]|uniref:ESX secretion-associated protein EspG n=1 Tax=Saccharothrix espanaensis TaxID=103731 RepID=UPI001E4B257D|nr:ESX secretion-associated protein EspG [Saccharothrix espanaensis]